jgi:hypothetical protein
MARQTAVEFEVLEGDTPNMQKWQAEMARAVQPISERMFTCNPRTPVSLGREGRVVGENKEHRPAKKSRQVSLSTKAMCIADGQI